MCPACILTAAAIVLGSTSVGGLSAFLLRKTVVRGQIEVDESRNSSEKIASTSTPHRELAPMCQPEQ